MVLSHWWPSGALAGAWPSGALASAMYLSDTTPSCASEYPERYRPDDWDSSRQIVNGPGTRSLRLANLVSNDDLNDDAARLESGSALTQT